MARAKDTDKVRVHYTGSLDDGTVFDSSREKTPLEFTIGNGEIIPGVENAVIGMSEGEEKKVTIPPEQGYGTRNEQAVMEISKDQLPNDVEPQVGMVLEGGTRDGSTVRLRVTAVKEDSLTVDANHPLAGKTLVFDIELVGIA